MSNELGEIRYMNKILTEKKRIQEKDEITWETQK